MLRLYHFDWSPYCLVIRAILDAARVPFELVSVSLGDRSSIWKATRGRYYQVPVVKDRRNVLFETGADSQVIAKYLDDRYRLGLFPREWEGVQSLVWRYFENDLEGVSFRLNDIHWQEFVPKREHCGFVRHKERRFGRGCLEDWRDREGELLAELEKLLLVPEEMLCGHPYLLGDRPLFVDFCLRGMLANLLYTGHYGLPESRPGLRAWHERMNRFRLDKSA